MDFKEDMDTAQSALSGDIAAIDRLKTEVLSVVLGTVLGICGDPQSREKAREIVNDLLADSFYLAGSRKERLSLLQSYRGNISLRGWYSRIAISRLKDWWRAGNPRRNPLNTHGEDLADSSPFDSLPDENPPKIDQDVLDLLRSAIDHGIRKLEPSDSTLVQLVFFHGVRQQKISPLLLHDPASTSRWIEKALKTVRESATEYLKEADPEFDFTFDDLCALCASHLGSIADSFKVPALEPSTANLKIHSPTCNQAGSLRP